MPTAIVALLVAASTGSVVLVLARWMNLMRARGSSSRLDGCIFGAVGVAAVFAGTGLYLVVWSLLHPEPRGTYGAALQVGLPLSLALAAALLAGVAWSVLRRSRLTPVALLLALLALVALVPFL